MNKSSQKTDCCNLPLREHDVLLIQEVLCTAGGEE